MRKVGFFKIDDKEYFRRDLKRQNCTGSQAEDILKKLNNFKAIYTLYGNKKQVDRYELTDYDGNKININQTDMEEAWVLNDCYAYFVGEKYCFDSDKPCGVVDIVEEEIE